MGLTPDVKIFLDIDGVMTFFLKQVENWGYKKLIKKGVRHSDPEMWKIINKDPYNFAASMPWENHGERLYMHLINLNLQVIPITHCPNEDWKLGRFFWIGKNMPWCEPPIFIPMNSSKALFCVGKTALLIDDMQVNVNDWRLAGGTAVLWDSAKPEESFASLNLALKDLGVL